MPVAPLGLGDQDLHDLDDGHKVRDNRHALAVVHGVMAGGAALIGLCPLLFQLGLIGPDVWMISVGLGCYLAYVPFGSMLFDRLIAAAGWVATAGFMIYVTDAFGYVGSVAITLFKDFGAKDLSWLEFFTLFSYFTSILCFVCFVFAGVYLVRRTRSRTRRTPGRASADDGRGPRSLTASRSPTSRSSG